MLVIYSLFGFWVLNLCFIKFGCRLGMLGLWVVIGDLFLFLLEILVRCIKWVVCL